MIFQGGVLPPSGSAPGLNLASEKLYQNLSKISKQHNSISNLVLSKFNVSIKDLNSFTYPIYLKLHLLSLLFSTYFENKESPIIFIITINVFILLY